MYGGQVGKVVGTGDFLRFAGSTLRGASLQISRSVNSGRASQVIALDASVQSCICWSYGTRAAAGAWGQLSAEVTSKCLVFTDGSS